MRLAWSADFESRLLFYSKSAQNHTGSGTEGDRGASYDRGFTYDRAGRLTQVTDITAPAGESINKDAAEGATTPVTVRKYSFDKNGNRTSLTTDVDGTQTAKRSWDYDAADRVGVSGGYVYDGLGRQTTIPAADAQNQRDSCRRGCNHARLLR